MKSVQRPRRLILIRHAESYRNALKKHNIYFTDDETRRTVRGIPDHEIELTEQGRHQAESAGKYLRARFGFPHYLYHSGYARTILTTEEILKAYTETERDAIKVRQNFFIRERDPGYSYDMTTEEAEAAFPWLKEHWQTFGGFFTRPPGGESLSDVAARVYEFINMLFRDRAGKNIFVVTHGGTIRCFRFLLERWTYEQALKWKPGQAPKNCSITVYEYDPTKEHLILKEYNTVCRT